MIYKNTKLMVCSPDGDTDFFDLPCKEIIIYLSGIPLTNSHILATIFHFLKVMSTYTKGRHGLLLTGCWSYENLIFLMKQNGISPSFSCVGITVWMHHLDSNEKHEVKARWEHHKNATCCFEQILEAAPHKTATVQPFTLLLKPFK